MTDNCTALASFRLVSLGVVRARRYLNTDGPVHGISEPRRRRPPTSPIHLACLRLVGQKHETCSMAVTMTGAAAWTSAVGPSSLQGANHA